MKAWILNNLNLIFATLIGIFMPVVPLVLTVLTLVIVDMIFAIYRQWKQDPTKITSRKMSNTISKILLYTLTIGTLHLFETYIIPDVLPITRLVAGLISLVEIKSIDETFKILLGYSLWDMFIKLIKRGQSSTKDLVDVVEDPVKKP